jgi:hypothetical protein
MVGPPRITVISAGSYPPPWVFDGPIRILSGVPLPGIDDAAAPPTAMMGGRERKAFDRRLPAERSAPNGAKKECSTLN